MTTKAPDGISNALLKTGMYRCLSEAFSYPTPELYMTLCTRGTTLLEWRSYWPAGMREWFAEILAILQKEDLSLLSEEYVRLFGPAARCPLTETSWGDSARLLGSSAQIADVSGFYRAFNIYLREDTDSFPEDHLAIQLEFMSVLCFKEAYALNAGLQDKLDITLDAQKKFLQEHLATWIDCWAENLNTNNPAHFTDPWHKHCNT
jgi:Uncharacterized component of anaerobic dehydrogenases